MATTKWIIDTTHSEIVFKARHLMISNVSGSFTEFNSELETENEDFENGKLTFTAKIDSITTGNDQRDGHLKSDDFFNAEKFPELKFEAKGLARKSEGEYEMDGNLTIRDITRPVKLQVESSGVVNDPWGNVRTGFSVSGKINRKDFGLKWDAVSETGGIMLGDEIKLQAEAQYVKQ
jgi:polyisoprenoid-binding protein YceI